DAEQDAAHHSSFDNAHDASRAIHRRAKSLSATYVGLVMSGRTVDKTSTSWRKLAGFLATFAAVSCSSTTAKPTRSATPAATQQEWSRFQSSKGNAPPDDAVVHVISRGVGCSGTLITNNLVLTAHHCMVERNANGDILEEDLPASELEVEVDGDSRPSMVPVLAAVAPPCGYRGGNGDIAVLVLSRRVMGRSTMPVRLSDPPQTGEVIEPLGYGHCSLSSEGNHRVRHLGGPIEELGPFAISAPAAICPGDSGGPAQSSLTGEAVGVVSAGIMDDSDQTRDQATFTRLDVWRPLFARARMIAEGSSPAEVPPIAACAAN
ncbi:MAG TPA: S1 family peptidase, partial [Polyangiaceae bacterium]